MEQGSAPGPSTCPRSTREDKYPSGEGLWLSSERLLWRLLSLRESCRCLPSGMLHGLHKKNHSNYGCRTLLLTEGSAAEKRLKPPPKTSFKGRGDEREINSWSNLKLNIHLQWELYHRDILLSGSWPASKGKSSSSAPSLLEHRCK